MTGSWHQGSGLRRGLWALLAGGALAGCCAKPSWYEIFDEGNNRLKRLPERYASKKLGSSYLDDRTCEAICGGAVEDCHLAEVKIAGAKVKRVAVCHFEGAERCWDLGRMSLPSGRRPAGLEAEVATSLLEALARLEAASVQAFERLAEELAGFGAPPALVRRARRAAEEERRHTRAVAALAGIAVPAVQVAAVGRRSLLEVARENAVEGCVHETFGALLAWHQATQAENPEAKRVFARIAPDETRHGALAWAVHRWAWPRLGAGEQAELAEAMRAAAVGLAEAPAPAPHPGLGLPEPEVWRRLSRSFARAVA